MAKAVAKITVTGKDTDEIGKLAGGLQDLANLVANNKITASNAILLLNKVKTKPEIIEKALKYI